MIDFWLQHCTLLAIVLPMVAALILILLRNPVLVEKKRWQLRYLVSYGAVGLGLVQAIAMLVLANRGDLQVYHLGQWAAPFGIVLVLDRLAALMITLTYVLAVPVLWFGGGRWDMSGHYFHIMLHFLLMGLCGAFLTGDLFNLFVFFEILLMASYVLLLHPHTKARFQLGIHYVSLNLLASLLFLIGLGLIYANVGTLNMADVARLYPSLPMAEHQLAMSGALLLFIVFALKAAVFPLGFWLPKTYAVAATPVAALFALMTKVGIYAMLRVLGTVFNDVDTHHILQTILLTVGCLSALYGACGALAAQRVGRFIGFMVLSSIGTLVIGLGLLNVAAWAGMLYYLVHSTLVAAALYLTNAWLMQQRGDFQDYLKIAPQMKQHQLLGGVFFLLALMMIGLPPFSGFIGKLLILQATSHQTGQLWIIGTIIITSLIAIMAFMRGGFVLFWRASTPEDNPRYPAYSAYQSVPDYAPPRLPSTIYALTLGSMIYALAAEPVYQYTLATAQQLSDRQSYQAAILKRDANQEVISVKPFDTTYVPKGIKDDPYHSTIPYTIHTDSLKGKNEMGSESRSSHVEQNTSHVDPR